MDEEVALIEYLRTGDARIAFADALHNRLAGALEDPTASALDRAVLVRQLLRRWSLRDGREVPVALGEAFSSSVRKAAVRAGLRERVDGMWVAPPWRPNWLDLDGGIPDEAALAGTEPGRRFHDEPMRADPFFAAITGYETYRTPGQRAACRAVMSVPEGSTVISMLPTGSGKTEIALCLAERSKYALTVIVVPTVALAYDFERRFREHFARRNDRIKPESLDFAWTASTDVATRERLKKAIKQGQQPLLVTSPESMTRALRQTLLESAAIGRLQGFVIDEAHLVTQWGRFFRPEFRSIADLRRDLLEEARQAGYPRAVTLLLSATLGAAEIDDLTTLFGDPGPCNPVVANALRSEPDIWVSRFSHEQERDSAVLETIAYCARPTVLYVTRPERAEHWLSELERAGYSRIASVTGSTKASERARVLEGIRAMPGTPPSIDLVVATSAFGLGIDYPHIRTVVHACLPETVDRWYQEFGRGGRDGDASAAFLLTAPGDSNEAESLGVRVLSPEVARKRWADMWEHRRVINGRTFVDLEGARGSVGRGDYNRRWNAQVIQGLVELRELKRDQFDVEDLRELLNSDEVDVSDWTAVSRTGARMGPESFWNEVWRPWQQVEMRRSVVALNQMRSVARLSLGACQGIAAAYAPTDELLITWGARLQFMEPTGTCGRCPNCRRHGVPTYPDPSPAPEQTWAVSPTDPVDLLALVTTAQGVNGLAFLTYGREEGGLVDHLAAGVARLGVRHFAGLPMPVQISQSEVTFIDEHPLAPLELTPVPSFSYFAHDRPVSRHWLSRRQQPRTTQDGTALVDILLVPRGSSVGGRVVGKDIPSLAARTVIELLSRS